MASNFQYTVGVRADVTEFRQQIQSLATEIQQLGMSNALNTDLKNASQSAIQLGNILKSSINMESGRLDLQKFTKQLNASGNSLKQYSQQLFTMGDQGKQSFIKLTEAIAQSEIPAKRLSGTFQKLGQTLANTVRWQISSSALSAFTSTISEGYQYAKQLNRSLNDIRIVTGYSADRMADFAKDANSAAKALSASTLDYSKASLIYFQQGVVYDTREEKIFREKVILQHLFDKLRILCYNI